MCDGHVLDQNLVIFGLIQPGRFISLLCRTIALGSTNHISIKFKYKEYLRRGVSGQCQKPL